MDTDSKTVTISNQDPQAFGVLDPFKPPLAALSSFALLSDFPPLTVLLSLAPLPLLFFALLPLQLLVLRNHLINKESNLVRDMDILRSNFIRHSRCHGTVQCVEASCEILQLGSGTTHKVDGTVRVW